MKRTLLITGITTLALAVGAMAEDQNHKGRAQSKAVAKTSARGNTATNVQARQNFTARQSGQSRHLTTRQNNSARTFNRRTAVNAQTNTQANVRTNRATTRGRDFRRAQTTTNNAAAVNNTTTAGRVGRRQALRDQRAQQRAITGTTANNNVAVNRMRNVNRNVSVVNNWRGSQFAGTRYAAFRDYHRVWHDRGWWDNNYGTSLTFVFGAPYFWNSGYWYPAWGYNPGYVYPYDGPIYGGAHLAPDQIVMNVQAQLRDDGYYTGPIDGVLGSQTRYALAQFQADNGLAVTSAVDQPTLATLGIS